MGLDQIIYDITVDKEVAYLRKCDPLLEFVMNNCELVDWNGYDNTHNIDIKDVIGVLHQMSSTLGVTLDTLLNMSNLLCNILGEEYDAEKVEYVHWLQDFEMDLHDFVRMLEVLKRMYDYPLHKYRIHHIW